MTHTFRNIFLLLQQYFMGFDPIVAEDIDDSILQNNPPIFLIGAPRSGSTAFIQLLYQTTQLAYISNLLALMPNKMVRLTKTFPSVAKGYRGGVRNSIYGYIPGLLSPNEAGKIMSFWFDSELNTEHIRAIRSTICTISNVTNCPLFFKNQCNTTRLDEIQTAIPNARFIFLRRNPLYTAQSILLTRRNLYNNDNTWWSVSPSDNQSVINHDPYYQIMWQVLGLEKIAQSVCDAKPTQCITIDYERLCEDPLKIIRTIEKHFSLIKRSHTPKSQPLRLANDIKISSDEWKQLELAYKRVNTDPNNN